MGLLTKTSKTNISGESVTSTTLTSTIANTSTSNTTNTSELCWLDENASFNSEYINTSTTGKPTINQLAYSGESLNNKKYKWAYDPNTINYITLDFDKLNKTYYSGNDLEGLKKTVSGKVIYVANKLITFRSPTESSVLTLKPCSEF